MSGRALALAAALGLAVASPAQAACREALALGLDVSGSVDGAEYRLQLDGLANALRDPAVRKAFLSMPAAPVRLAVFEWSGETYQRLLVDWTEIAEAATLDAVAETLARKARGPGPPETAVGAAMRFGAGLLDGQPGCWRRVLDLSGDGKHNTGPHPRLVRQALDGAGITINALVIGAEARHDGDLRQVEIGELTAYFSALVILGPDAFVETALGFDDYQRAMTRKLLRELEGLVLSSLPAGHRGPRHAPGGTARATPSGLHLPR